MPIIFVNCFRESHSIRRWKHQPLATRQVRGAVQDIAQSLQVAPYLGRRSRNGGSVPGGQPV